MSDTTNSPPIQPTITIYQLRRDDQDVVIYGEHPVKEYGIVADDHYLVELSSPLYHALLAAKLKVGEIALIQLLEALGAHSFQKAEINITAKPMIMTVRPVRRS